MSDYQLIRWSMRTSQGKDEWRPYEWKGVFADDEEEFMLPMIRAMATGLRDAGWNVRLIIERPTLEEERLP